MNAQEALSNHGHGVGPQAAGAWRPGSAWKVQEGLRSVRSLRGSARARSGRASVYSAVAVCSPASASSPVTNRKTLPAPPPLPAGVA